MHAVFVVVHVYKYIYSSAFLFNTFQSEILCFLLHYIYLTAVVTFQFKILRKNMTN